MSKHTPGPWEVSTLDGRTVGPVRTVTVEDAGGWTATPIPQTQAVCVLKERAGETEANGRLIAAAPDMLAVLKRLAEYCEQHSVPELQGIACDAFQVIARAEGGA